MKGNIKVRSYAIDILDLFEEVLDEHDIVVPDDDRTGSEGEASLYGATYFDLEDRIVGVLDSLIKNVKSNPDAEIELNDL